MSVNRESVKTVEGRDRIRDTMILDSRAHWVGQQKERSRATSAKEVQVRYIWISDRSK